MIPAKHPQPARSQQSAVSIQHLASIVDRVFVTGSTVEIQCSRVEMRIADLSDMVTRAFNRANYHPEARP